LYPIAYNLIDPINRRSESINRESNKRCLLYIYYKRFIHTVSKLFTDRQRLFQYDHDKTQVQAHHQTHPGTAVWFAAVETSGRQTAGRAVDETTKADTPAGQQTGRWYF